MTTTLIRQRSWQRRKSQSAYGLLMDYEQALAGAVEATLAEGLAQVQVSAEAAKRAANTWRDLLTIIAAEELSRRLSSAAAKGMAARISVATVARALKPYAALVAEAAEAEMAHPSDTFMAAD